MTKDERMELFLSRFDCNPETGEVWKKSTGFVYNKPNKYGYVQITTSHNNKSRNMAAHRFVYLYVTGELPDELDHIDTIRHNNSFSNLRIASRTENNYNRNTVNKSTGVKGVYKNKSGSYSVRIVAGSKYKSFGSYEDLELAELVAQEVREKYHGEFCRH